MSNKNYFIKLFKSQLIQVLVKKSITHVTIAITYNQQYYNNFQKTMLE